MRNKRRRNENTSVRSNGVEFRVNIVSPHSTNQHTINEISLHPAPSPSAPAPTTPFQSPLFPSVLCPSTPSPSAISLSSLPPYDSVCFNADSDDSQLPTYKEAIALPEIKL